jgi:hypothetical protein
VPPAGFPAPPATFPLVPPIALAPPVMLAPPLEPPAVLLVVPPAEPVGCPPEPPLAGELPVAAVLGPVPGASLLAPQPAIVHAANSANAGVAKSQLFMPVVCWFMFIPKGARRSQRSLRSRKRSRTERALRG